jgi:hypothetical protein
MEIPLPGSLQGLSRQWMVRWRVSRLRRISPRPFGLTGDQERRPLTLGSESASAGLIEEISAAVTRSAVSLGSLGLMYGDYFDLSKPLVEVTTHWDGRSWFTPGKPPGVPASAWELIPAPAWDLGDAERRDEAIARQDWKALGYPQRIAAEGPFGPGSAEIVTGGSPREVPAVFYKHYVALSFSEGNATVTVVSRHPLPEMPHFDPVTDLESFYAGYAQSLEELAERLDGRRH